MPRTIEKYIWLKNETRVAKIGWVKEADSGLYFSPRPDFRSIHYSYHTPGIHHLTTSSGHHHQKAVAPLASIEYWGNVGGFGIELGRLEWLAADAAKKHDIFIQVGPHAMTGQYVVVSLNLVLSERVTEFIAAKTQTEGSYLAHCISFQSALFPHLHCVILFQFQALAAEK